MKPAVSMRICVVRAAFGAGKDGSCHRKWRRRVVIQVERHYLLFTHGVAAKLINCYLKSRLVCGRYHADARVKSLHPPIDAVILRTLAQAGYRRMPEGMEERTLVETGLDRI